MQLRPPLPKPDNIDCMAVNYMEDGTRTEPAPINAFHKSPSAIIGDGDTMVLPDVPATIFEGEAELARGHRQARVATCSAADAMSYVFGYTNFIDGSARGLPPPGNTFYQMKSRDTFAPIGPYIVTADEIARPAQAAGPAVGQRRAQAELQHRRHGAQDPALHRVGHVDPHARARRHPRHRHQPPRALAFQDGDKVELETEGLGTLHINVSDELKRTWARETRLERQEKRLERPTHTAAQPASTRSRLYPAPPLTL